MSDHKPRSWLAEVLAEGVPRARIVALLPSLDERRLLELLEHAVRLAAEKRDA
jgi:hypothetical protein